MLDGRPRLAPACTDRELRSTCHGFERADLPSTIRHSALLSMLQIQAMNALPAFMRESF